ncbi:MAG TPA: methyltransferase domain-containing protein [Pseudomonadales bacterium]|nr:methyltransferase domain-containing protein [Pseudomonadales bacterium]
MACPLDGLPLARADRRYACASGHSFDIARQGYLNLLPVQHKQSKDPGDSAAMVAARSAFLDSGAFEPIAAELSRWVSARLVAASRAHACVLDAGCGEGYHLVHLLRSLGAQRLDARVALIGMDISKPAILAAARRSKRITWLVASNKRPPLLPGTVDVVCSTFGFPLFEQFATLLAPGGRIVLVDAGPEHLIELRRVVYPTIEKDGPLRLEATAAGLSLIETRPLSYRRTLDSNAQILNWLAMTPHAFRIGPRGRQAASELHRIDVTVDVVFRVLRRATES